MEWSLAGKPERVGPVEVEDIRKDLFSDFSALPTQDSQSENLQVFLRIRPFTSAESDSEETQDCVTMEGPDTVILKAPRANKSLPQTGQRFTFTQVFGPDSSQRAVFEGSVRSLVRDVLDGGNCLVFTYGVTNAGKTFTFLGPDHDLGLLPRSLAVIFNSIEGKLYSRCDLKPQRCRDYTRLTPDQQSLESVSKRTLMKMFKETDKTLTSGKSMFLDGSNVTDSSLSSSSENDSFVLEVEDTVKFSVWVSFCEIYNDNIHDLLEHVPNGHQKRTVLRLSQDVKGNSFIKDLRWVQVSSSDEAYRVMKIGKKNQSFSATRLNQLSSRSHSIFSIRLMKIDDVGVPRVLAISELALCDLAGSERCSRTHNTGDRLKEAGNINNSLLTLGKCISAMRTNQHSKFQQHIPFRESKLTHFLQFFFCGSGSGKVTMVVNINQSSSSLDETLNVLKFSALAQKVVVLNARPAPLDAAPQRSAMELSLIIDEAETRRFRGRKSSMVWERSLEDVLETEDWDHELDEEQEEEEEEEEQTEMEGTVLEVTVDETTMEGTQSDRAAALRLVLEAQIREEVSAEFMELFNKMEKDYSERLEKEREILEERAEKRLEILKNLVHRTVDLSALERQDPEQGAVLESIISAQDLEKIREEQDNAREVQSLRVQRQETLEQLEAARQSVEERVQQVSELAELCRQKDDIINKLTSTLDQTVEDATRERSVVESVRAELMQLQQNCSCLRRRGVEEGEEIREQGKEERKLPRGSSDDETGPTKKRALLEEEIWRLHEEIDQKEHLICELRQDKEEEETRLNQTITRLQEELQQRGEEETRLNQTMTRLQEDLQQRGEEETRLNQTITRLQEDLQQRGEEETRLNQTITRLQEDLQQRGEEETRLNQTITRLQEEQSRLNQTLTRLQEDLQQREEELEHVRRGQMELETKVQELSEETGCSSCESVFLSLESEQKETSRLNKENKALVNGMFQLQNQVTDLKKQLHSQSHRSDSLSEELTCTKTRLDSLQNQSEEKEHTIHELRGEVERLRQDAKEENMFHEAMDRLKEESESALSKSAEKTQQIQELQEKLQHSERLCTELRQELTNQRAAFACLEAELKEHCASFKQRLETIEEERERTDQRNRDLLEIVSLREQTVAEAHSQMETLRKELERLREELQDPSEEEEKESQPEHQQQNLEENPEENHHQKLHEEEVTEERKVTLVEELREELQKLQQRRNNRARKQEQSQEQENIQENTEEESQTDKNEREEKRREERRMEAVKREVQRFRELQNHHNVKSLSPEKMAERRRTPRTTGRKRKSCEVQGLVFSENKRNRGRAQLGKQASSSSLKDRPLNKLGDLLHKSPSIISSTAKGLMGLVVDSKSTGSKLKRGRRKLYRTHSNSPMADSPVTACEGLLEEKESDHFTIKRQLRSKRK